MLTARNKALTVILVLALIFSAFNIFAVRFAKANPPPGIPSITILSPCNQTYDSGLLFLNVSIYCFAGFAGNRLISYSLDGGDNITLNCKPVGANAKVADTYSGLVFFPDVFPIPSDGTHSIRVYALFDFGDGWHRANGDPLITTNSKTVYFTIDSTSPQISVISPEPSEYNKSIIPLNVLTDKPVTGMSYSLDGKAQVNTSGNSTLAGLSDGEHSVVVYSTAVSGGAGISEKILFKVDTQPAIVTPKLTFPSTTLPSFTLFPTTQPTLSQETKKMFNPSALITCGTFIGTLITLIAAVILVYVYLKRHNQQVPATRDYARTLR
jgi:hypothetical protein